MNKTISGLIKEYFDRYPNKDLPHDDVVDYVFKSFPKARDPWRAVRKLYEEGYLIQVGKGVYRRVPGYRGNSSEDPFPSAVARIGTFKTIPASTSFRRANSLQPSF